MKISACLIMKNEEKNIGFYIESLQGYVDEYIFVDTGSEDKTVEIAKAHGITVYDYPWHSDFSAAKNYALDKANGDWVVFLDADEYFSSATISHIAQLILAYGGQYDAFLSKMINIDVNDENKWLDDFYTVRVFRNLPRFRYVGAIHEQIKAIEGMEIRVKLLAERELCIYHTGYSSERIEAKARRNIALMEAALQKGVEATPYYVYMAEAYAALGDDEQATRYAELDIRSGKKAITYASRSHRIRIEALKRLRRNDIELKNAIEAALRDFPDVPDFYAEYGLFFYQRKDNGQARACFGKALALIDSYNGLEPCTAARSIDLLRRLYRETVERSVRGRDESVMENEQELLIKQKNRKFYQGIIHKIATKLQIMAISLIADGGMGNLAWRDVLPDELTNIVLRCIGKGERLPADAFSMYLTLFDRIVQLHNPEVLQRYLNVSEDFGNEQRAQMVKKLAENQMIYDIKSFMGLFTEKELLSEDLCYFVGKTYYFHGFYQEAELYFKQAEMFKVKQRDIPAYLSWIAERR